MEYRVEQEYYNQEFDFVIYPDETYSDGEIEPDLVANLIVAGVLTPIGGPDVEPEEEEEDEDE